MLIEIRPECQALEVELVQSATAGNRAAFGKLYTRYRSMVHGILLAHVSFSDAEDLMQDVFVAAMQKIKSLRDAGAFGGWLMAITRNTAIDHQRRSIHVVEVNDRTCKAEPEHRERASGAEVMEAIKSLPETYRETLILRLVEGMTGPEIAARTGLQPDSVRVNLCRGMKLLRERLQ